MIVNFNMSNSVVYNEIIKRLKALEKEENIQVLFACESGSRAWGFPSVDSDYDVRFIYLRDKDWYLSIDEGRDVIEKEISDLIDLSGWDLKKALKLYRKSNPPLIEWLCSPIVYVEKYSIAQQLRDNLSEFYSPLSSMYHYLHMAEGNFRDYLKGEEVWVKKYFYVLRPVLACNWIERGLGPVPTEFSVLVDKIVEDKKLKSSIEKLINEKKRGNELSKGPRINIISEYIEEEIPRLKKITIKKKRNISKTNRLNKIFRAALEEVWK